MFRSSLGRASWVGRFFDRCEWLTTIADDLSISLHGPGVPRRFLFFLAELGKLMAEESWRPFAAGSCGEESCRALSDGCAHRMFFRACEQLQKLNDRHHARPGMVPGFQRRTEGMTGHYGAESKVAASAAENTAEGEQLPTVSERRTSSAPFAREKLPVLGEQLSVPIVLANAERLRALPEELDGLLRRRGGALLDELPPAAHAALAAARRDDARDEERDRVEMGREVRDLRSEIGIDARTQVRRGRMDPAVIDRAEESREGSARRLRAAESGARALGRQRRTEARDAHLFEVYETLRGMVAVIRRRRGEVEWIMSSIPATRSRPAFVHCPKHNVAVRAADACVQTGSSIQPQWFQRRRTG
jgi:hypothetical protein